MYSKHHLYKDTNILGEKTYVAFNIKLPKILLNTCTDVIHELCPMMYTTAMLYESVWVRLKYLQYILFAITVYT